MAITIIKKNQPPIKTTATAVKKSGASQKATGVKIVKKTGTMSSGVYSGGPRR